MTLNEPVYLLASQLSDCIPADARSESDI